MSRTYRWKSLGQQSFREWAGYQYDENGDLKEEYNVFWRREKYTPLRVEKAKARYHAEWRRGLPKVARHFRNKAYRRKEQNLLVSVMRGQESIFDPFKKDAAYYYY